MSIYQRGGLINWVYHSLECYPVILKSGLLGWEDSPVGDVLVLQARGSEFDSQNSHKNALSIVVHT